MVELPDDVIEATARAMALVDEENGCFERVDEFDAITDPAEAEDYIHAHGYPHDDREDCEYWRRRARAAFEVIATRVRAEAVADEEQRLAAIRVLAEAGRVSVPHAPYTGVSWQRLFEVLDDPQAAGSVLVATPEPDSVAELAKSCGECTEDGLGNCQHGCREAERWDAFYRGGVDARHDLELGCAESCPCSNPRPGPVATPTEPARCEHGSEFAHPWLVGSPSERHCPGPAASPGTLGYAQRIAERRGDLADAADEDGMG